SRVPFLRRKCSAPAQHTPNPPSRATNIFVSKIHWRQGPSCPAVRGRIAGPGPRNSERRAPAGERLSEGARRGGWLGRRSGANRSVAGCHVRIRARPRTTPDAPYRPAPLHLASEPLRVLP